jgi:hypothetical protein
MQRDETSPERLSLGLSGIRDDRLGCRWQGGRGEAEKQMKNEGTMLE